MLANMEMRKLPTLERDLQENVNMLIETIRAIIGETKDFVEKGECVAGYTQDQHRNTLMVTVYLRILTFQCRRLVNEVNQQCISLASMALLMHDAMASSVHGSMPMALITPTIPTTFLNTFELYRLSEAIPGKLKPRKLVTKTSSSLEPFIHWTRVCFCW